MREKEWAKVACAVASLSGTPALPEGRNNVEFDQVCPPQEVLVNDPECPPVAWCIFRGDYRDVGLCQVPGFSYEVFRGEGGEGCVIHRVAESVRVQISSDFLIPEGTFSITLHSESNECGRILLSCFPQKQNPLQRLLGSLLGLFYAEMEMLFSK